MVGGEVEGREGMGLVEIWRVGAIAYAVGGIQGWLGMLERWALVGGGMGQ